MPNLSRWLTLGFGLAAACFLAGAPVSTAASSLQTIYQFDPTTDGNSPSNLIAASDGRLFGTNHGEDGIFQVFELDPPPATGGQWAEHTIFRFPQHYHEDYGHNLLLGATGHLFATSSLYVNGVNDSTLWELLPPASGNTNWTAAVRAATPKAGGVPIGEISLFYIDSSNVLFGSGYKMDGSNTGVLVRLAPYSADPARYLVSVLAPSCDASEPADCGSITGLVPLGDGSFFGSDNYVLFHLTPPAAAAGWTRQTYSCLPHVSCSFYLSVRVSDRSQTLYVRSDATPGSSAVVKVPRPWSAGTTLVDFSDGRFGSVVTDLVEDRSGLLFAATELSSAPSFGTIVSFWSGTPGQPKLVHAFSGSDGALPSNLVKSLRPGGSLELFGLTFYGGKGTNGTNIYAGGGTVFQIIP